ncbi:MAG TPA: alkaline phosphatase family protein [Mycobacteriales bacterium]|nr:alkaline phosphatase family protein [Mycobacteriales bacterium]
MSDIHDDPEARAERLKRLGSMSRRELIAAISALGAAAVLGLPEPAAAAVRSEPAARAARRAARIADQVSSVAHAAGIGPAGGDLGAIDHIVFLMLENRSYDHYFGAYPRGRGFDDHPKHSLGAFAQDYPGGSMLSPRNLLLPFHLDPKIGEECTNDLTHDWEPQHQSWNHGKMNRFVKTHTSKTYEGNPDGAMTMGYYTRRDLPFHWALADHFTLCDAYFASVMGPTHPNRLMANSGTIDPEGHHGGPITETNPSIYPDFRWTCTWPTVQEHLEDKGVSWKVYHPSNAHVTGKYARLKNFPTWDPSIYAGDSEYILLLTDHVLPYFKAFKKATTPLHHKAFTPTFPNDFQSDVRSGNLPHVSWIIPPLGFDEHPSSPPDRGMWFVQSVLDELSSHQKLWSKTALIVMYDENDGWFDHVPPPTAPKGTKGEWLTANHKSSTQYQSIAGPVGLGIRVPALVISPFSRGGHIATEVFDHTSQLKLVSERFGIEVPNVSEWRKRTVGDLTSALFRGSHNAAMPALPKMPLGSATGTGTCTEEDTEMGGAAPTIPTNQRMPTQHGKTVPATRWYPAAATSTDRIPARSGRNTATTKSATNALMHGAVVEPAQTGKSGRRVRAPR